MLIVKTTDAVSTLGRLNLKLSRKEIAKATSRAINRTLEAGRTIVRKEVKQIYNISQQYVKDIDIERANVNKLQGDIHASSKPTPLDAFSAKQETASGSISISKKGQQKTKTFKRPKKNPTAGVSIEVIRGQKEVIPFAFMIGGGAARVFARGEYREGTQHGFIRRFHRVNSTGNDTPVKPLITLSVFGTVINDKVINKVGKEVRTRYPQRLAHEIKFIADQVG